mmetsp:Transcript_32772/g.103691  ORF Transcript_32772/g.103691 Transcript_32772/m.103691 type:complete len:221 (-) Transcript_32772:1379-2041(-)
MTAKNHEDTKPAIVSQTSVCKISEKTFIVLLRSRTDSICCEDGESIYPCELVLCDGRKAWKGEHGTEGNSKKVRELYLGLETRLLSRDCDGNLGSISFDEEKGILRFEMSPESVGKKRKNEELEISLTKVDKVRDIQDIIKDCARIRLRELNRLDQDCDAMRTSVNIKQCEARELISQLEEDVDKVKERKKVLYQKIRLLINAKRAKLNALKREATSSNT